MVPDENNKTKIDFAISFAEEKRLFGYDAKQKQASFPKSVLTHMHSFLGKSLNDTDVVTFMQNFFNSYDVVENNDTSTIGFKVDYMRVSHTFKIEEIYAMVLRYISYLADSYAKTDIHDCIITIPSFYGFKEKKAIENAVVLTGLKLLLFTYDNTAAAVTYMINRRLNVTRNVLFYNMGASYTQASLIHFSFGPQGRKVKVTFL